MFFCILVGHSIQKSVLQQYKNFYPAFPSGKEWAEEAAKATGCCLQSKLTQEIAFILLLFKP